MKLRQISPKDNVAVAVKAVEPGDALPGGAGTVLDAAGPGHKIALRDIAVGEPVFKIGVAIGVATQAIPTGGHVHSHNLEMLSHEAMRSAKYDVEAVKRDGDWSHRTFQGYRRASGKVGTRNYIGVLPTVNCSATVARMIADRFRDIAQTPDAGVDGVMALTHGGGCSVSAFEDGYALLQRTLAGYARHPNFAGILVVGLGCENNTIHHLREEYGLDADDNVQFMNIQDTGGTVKTVDAGAKIVEAMIADARSAVREELPISHLTMALQCGGSDGFSAISANPALGVASDLLVAAGGSSILAETSEIYGAHHLLKARAVRPVLATAIDDLIEWWVEYTGKFGGTVDKNPTTGNKAGGLTTIIEKSLGSTSKGGHAPLSDVIQYAAPVKTAGLTFMDSPGNDPVSITGQVASGANIVCFTTGRGSVFGGKPAPSIKLATNSILYENMSDDMDINCGQVVDGAKSVEEMGAEILEEVIAVASGKPSKSEALGFGHEEIVPWANTGTV
ncbi:MAG: altronate dehydratase family protein [Pseudomonadota bacterium]